jgi:hypothetical protein
MDGTILRYARGRAGLTQRELAVRAHVPQPVMLRAGDAFTFRTDIGWLDLLGRPAGTDGYEDLARTADAFDLFGYRVLVASIEDLIRMKRASGRPKDLPALEELGAQRHVLDEG